ncbi:MAG: CopG family transcriptional regulator [Chloroflexota bacterium]|nr:CopG family transcriptional regulator [Chloroflexota bacterium]
MRTQNITLSLPKKTLHKVKLIAVQKETSLSGLLTQVLDELVTREEEYIRARRQHLAWMEHCADLGTGGEIHWKRDDIHER